MVTAFVDMAGLLMIIPLLPFYAKSMGAGGFVVGAMISSFSVAQLLSAPVWGRFSDRYGRRPALLVGLGASAISFVIFAYANSLWLLFAARLVQGLGSAFTWAGAFSWLLAAAPQRLLGRVSQATSVTLHGLVAQIRDGPSIYFGDASRLSAKWIAASAVLADSKSAGAIYIDVTDPQRPAAGAGSDGSSGSSSSTSTNPATGG